MTAAPFPEREASEEIPELMVVRSRPHRRINRRVINFNSSYGDGYTLAGWAFITGTLALATCCTSPTAQAFSLSTPAAGRSSMNLPGSWRSFASNSGNLGLRSNGLTRLGTEWIVGDAKPFSFKRWMRWSILVCDSQLRCCHLYC